MLVVYKSREERDREKISVKAEKNWQKERKILKKNTAHKNQKQ